MKNHKLEIYLDSYDSVPFVTTISRTMTPDGPLDSSVCDWLRSQTGKSVDIEKDLKIEDVSHPGVTGNFEATRLRVKLV